MTKRHPKLRHFLTFPFRSALVVMLLLLGACDSGTSGVDRPILIKFSHVTSPATPKGQTAEMFKKLVEERMAGRVEVEVYPSAQLMSDDDSIDALAFGEIQMIAISLSKLDRLTKKYQLFDLPFLFPDLEAVEEFQASDTGRELLSAMSRAGLLGLGFWHNGMKQFGGPVPMRSPADAAGLKFRIMESDVLQEQILQLKGNPQKMAFGEVYQALQTGAVDAQENTWSNIYSSKFYEVQPYITQTNHGYLGYLLTVNADFWSKLPEDLRAELEAIATEVTEWGNSRSREINQEGKEKIGEEGSSEIIELTEAERLVWQAAMIPVWDKFRNTIGDEAIQAARAFSHTE